METTAQIFQNMTATFQGMLLIFILLVSSLFLLVACLYIFRKGGILPQKIPKEKTHEQKKNDIDEIVKNISMRDGC